MSLFELHFVRQIRAAEFVRQAQQTEAYGPALQSTHAPFGRQLAKEELARQGEVVERTMWMARTPGALHPFVSFFTPSNLPASLQLYMEREEARPVQFRIQHYLHPYGPCQFTGATP